MDKQLILKVQSELKDRGFDPGGLDGLIGPKTEQAIRDFKKSVGLASRPYLGPLTLSALLGIQPADLQQLHHASQEVQLPWLNELAKHIGWSETANNIELRKWLDSDGSTVGDPSRVPWCGDCMETAIRLSLPGEWDITDRRLRQNPYWADNWRYFGASSPEAYGALATFKRDGGNHIACLVGVDRKLKRYRIRGGNQSNRVSDTWIDISRNTSIRRPTTWYGVLPKLPEMNSEGQIISTNEA